jgi:hypothetical protein
LAAQSDVVLGQDQIGRSGGRFDIGSHRAGARDATEKICDEIAELEALIGPTIGSARLQQLRDARDVLADLVAWLDR